LKNFIRDACNFIFSCNLSFLLSIHNWLKRPNRTEQTLSAEFFAAETIRVVVFYDKRLWGLVQSFWLSPVVCLFGATAFSGPGPPHSRGFLWFLDHTQRRTTVGSTPLDELSARRRAHYLTTHNTHNRQTSMPPVGFEPTISAGERP
jgi:hypothetical protein